VLATGNYAWQYCALLGLGVPAYRGLLLAFPAKLRELFTRMSDEPSVPSRSPLAQKGPSEKVLLCNSMTYGFSSLSCMVCHF
jgi:hypothetical protein